MKKLVMAVMLSAAFWGCEDQSAGGEVYSVSVFLGDKDQGDVNIYDLESNFETVSVSGVEVTGLSVAAMIEQATGIQAGDLDKYICDYEAKDGFRPSSKGDRCPMVSCSYAAASYIDVGSKMLVYGEDAPMKDGPGCYGVDGLTKILMYPAE